MSKLGLFLSAILFCAQSSAQVTSPKTGALSANGEMPLNIAIDLRLAEENLVFSKGHAKAIEILDLVYVEHFFSAVRKDVRDKAKLLDRSQGKQNATRSDEQLNRSYVTHVGFEIHVSGSEDQDKIEVWNQVGANSKLLGLADVSEKTKIRLAAPWELGTLLLKYRPHYNSRARTVKLNFETILCTVSLPGQKGSGTQVVAVKTNDSEDHPKTTDEKSDAKSDSTKSNLIGQPKFVSLLTKQIVKINRTQHRIQGHINWYELNDILQKDMVDQFKRDIYFQNLVQARVDMILPEVPLKNEFLDQLSEVWAEKETTNER